MSGYDPSRLLNISRQFHIYGELLHAEPCKVGHINETYTATYEQGGKQIRYIHQRINHEVFKDPVGLMDNLQRVTTHLRQKFAELGVRDITRRALTVIPTRDGRSYFKTTDGEFWRTFVFIENVRTFESVESGEQAYESREESGEEFHGRRLGSFSGCWWICPARGCTTRSRIFTTRESASRRLRRR